MDTYKITLTVKKEINNKVYGEPCNYGIMFVDNDGFADPNIKPFLENDKEFERKMVEKLFDLLLRQFYGKEEKE